MVEVDFGLTNRLLCEFKPLQVGLRLPHRLAKVSVGTLALELRVIGVAKIFILAVIELELEDVLGALGVLGQVLVETLSDGAG